MVRTNVQLSGLAIGTQNPSMEQPREDFLENFSTALLATKMFNFKLLSNLVH